MSESDVWRTLEARHMVIRTNWPVQEAHMRVAEFMVVCEYLTKHQLNLIIATEGYVEEYEEAAANELLERTLLGKKRLNIKNE